MSLMTVCASGEEHRNQVRYFPRHALPLNPTERFARLFSEQSRWIYEELAEFVE